MKTELKTSNKLNFQKYFFNLGVFGLVLNWWRNNFLKSIIKYATVRAFTEDYTALISSWNLHEHYSDFLLPRYILKCRFNKSCCFIRSSFLWYGCFPDKTLYSPYSKSVYFLILFPVFLAQITFFCDNLSTDFIDLSFLHFSVCVEVKLQ